MKNYNRPELENLGNMKAEQVFAAHSWNNGQGNKPDSNGNDGENYYDGKGNSNKHQ